jgi:enoyl-CoA hydratase
MSHRNPGILSSELVTRHSCVGRSSGSTNGKGNDDDLAKREPVTTVQVDFDYPLATVTMSRPDALNAITADMLEELVKSFELIAATDKIAVVVLTGAGRAFSAGVDLKALAGRSLTGGSVGDLLDVPAGRLINLLTMLPKIVVAKVNGACFTGALELALACDLIVTADEAKFGDTHARWGLRPTWGMSQRLIRLVGVARARELSYTARTFSGIEAAAWGLAVRSIPAAQLNESVDNLVAEIAEQSSGSLAAYKDLYRVSLDGGLAHGLEYESSARFAIEDTESRIASFFR